MLERLKQSWRFFVAAPAGPMTAESFKATLLKLSRTDPATRDTLAKIGISPEMLGQSDFDLRTFLQNRKVTIALERALETEDGRDLLARAAEFEPSSEEMGRLHDDLVERFGSPSIENLLRSMPP